MGLWEVQTEPEGCDNWGGHLEASGSEKQKTGKGPLWWLSLGGFRMSLLFPATSCLPCERTSSPLLHWYQI